MLNFAQNSSRASCGAWCFVFLIGSDGRRRIRSPLSPGSTFEPPKTEVGFSDILFDEART